MTIFADPADYAEMFLDGAWIEITRGCYPAISHMSVEHDDVQLHLTLWTGRDNWTLHRRLVRGASKPVRIGECQPEHHALITQIALEAPVSG